MSERKVVIIGAGPSGLTAGYKLLSSSKDYKVVILEEAECVGGISRTIVHNGNRMDIGGHRFFSKVPEVNAMWQELMPLQGKPSYDDRLLERIVNLSQDGPDPEKTDLVMLSRNRVSRIFYKRHFFDYPIKMSLQTILNMGFATTICAVMSYFRASLKSLPEDSLENFYINRFGRKLYSMFFEGYTEKLWGRHPREISASWGAQRVKGLSIVAVIKDMLSKMLPSSLSKGTKVETSLISEFHYPKFGPGQLWEKMAKDFVQMGGKILHGHKVVSVRLNGNIAKRVLCATDNGPKEFDADYLISSMPIKDLINGMNDVPQDIRAIADGLPYRDFMTIGLLVDKINLRNETRIKTLNSIVPDCWIYVQDTSVKLGRIQIFNNWSPYMLKNPEHSLWIGLEYFCNEGDELWSKSSEDFKTLAVSELVKIGILAPDETVHDFHVEKVKKAYPAYFDTYDRIDCLVDYLNSIRNLYCIGRNGQHRYNNMDHSMMTAFEAVRNILADGCDDKSAIWNVNTEKEYHEGK